MTRPVGRTGRARNGIGVARRQGGIAHTVAPRGDFIDWRAVLGEVVVPLLGDPNPRLSSSKALRYGSKGSLVIHVSGEWAGTWYDFEAGEGGGVLSLVVRERGGDEAAAMRWLRDGGLLEPQPTSTRYSGPLSKRTFHTRSTTAAERRAAAARLWDAGQPVGGTVAQGYLDTRGVGHVAGAPSLRFLECCPHPGGVYPALLSRVVDADGGFLGIQRTFLATDGAGKAAVAPVRASLGHLGGGAVRLGDVAADRLLVGEGIESTVAAMVVLNLPGWATLGTSGMRAVQLPASVREVVIAADPDAGGLRAAAALAERLEGEGRTVGIHVPQAEAGGDFNNLLLEALL